MKMGRSCCEQLRPVPVPIRSIYPSSSEKASCIDAALPVRLLDYQGRHQKQDPRSKQRASVRLLRGSFSLTPQTGGRTVLAEIRKPRKTGSTPVPVFGAKGAARWPQGLISPCVRVQFPAAPLRLIRRSAAFSNTFRAQDEVLPSAAVSSIARSASVRQILRMFCCRSDGFFGGRPAMTLLWPEKYSRQPLSFHLCRRVSMAIIIDVKGAPEVLVTPPGRLEPAFA